ncbi:Flp/Fap pilin component [Roseovarius sp. THAF9]|uniref:Flp family type IVb pilin n=1 Tax=Roseovarius sp. THAF9 TaxID=2587847 RepID=UPI00126892EC|nr:Flp family type IVb pilin [Roseovarius sp. THAF9]QFT92045.1 Flp/Fap pilin component [Roseovarius sp. THAF9]
MSIARKSIKTIARSFARDEDGATAIEYGLFAALVGAVIVGTVATLGTNTNTGFQTMNTELENAQSSGTD